MKLHATFLAAAAAMSLMGTACTKKHIPAAQLPRPTALPPASNSAPAAVSVRPPAATPSDTTATAPRYPDAATRARIGQLLGRIEDAYFDYDKATLRPDAIQALTAASTELASILKNYPDYKLTIEGHCDERGSAEYNLALGDRRAEAAKEYLTQTGVPAGQLRQVSYGKDRQVCQEHEETCWQKNRRVHILAMAQ